MKPSQKIAEHFDRILRERPGAVDLIHKDKHHQWKVEIAAIKDYLDEEYEKNRPCEHKSSYRVDGLGEVYYNVCDDCGVLFLAKKDNEKS